MRVWPLASVLVLVVASGCKSTPADESSKHRHEDDTTSASESSTHDVSTHSTELSSYSYGHETSPYSAYGMGNAQYNVGPMMLGAPIAKSYMRKGAESVLGGLGLTVLLSSLDIGPFSIFSGGGGGMLLLSAGLVATFAFRVSGPSMPDEEPGKARDAPKRKRPRGDDMDRPDMPAPSVPPGE